MSAARKNNRVTFNKLQEDLMDSTASQHEASLQHFASWLTDIPDLQPDEAHLNETLSKLRLEMHILTALQPVPTRRQSIRKMLVHVLHECGSIHPLYWIACLLLFACTLTLIVLSEHHAIGLPYLLALSAPLPFLLGMLEVFRSRQFGMLELENSCVYNASAIASARLLLVSVFSLLLNALPVWVISLIGEPLPTLQAILLCLVPLTVCSGLALYVSLRFRGTSGLYALFVIWLAVGLLALVVPGIGHALMNLHPAAYALIMITGVLFFCMQVRTLHSRMGTVEA